MINANECRIGNRFIRELGMEYDHEFILDEEQMGNLFNSEYEYLALNDLFPVPITPEILGLYGFKNNGAMYSKPENCTVDFDLTYTNIYSERLEDDIQFDLPKSLHLFQNLYYAVTNSELEINP